jgi:hypothetical protein
MEHSARNSEYGVIAMRPGVMHVFIAVVLFCTMAGIVSAATVSQNINYQGKLTDSSGNPLTGTYSITFKLYNVASEGSAVATSTQSVQCTNGLFTVSLPFPAGYYNGGGLWLGITVGTDAEMTPRQELRPVPYALSLRPGAVITSSDTSPALNLQNTGAKIKTIFSGCRGVEINTTNTDSPGITADTWGGNSNVFVGNSHGPGSSAVDVSASGTGASYGMKSYSAQSDGIYAETGKPDHKYGIYTPDFLYAMGAIFEPSGYGTDGVSIKTTESHSRGLTVNTTNSYSQGIIVDTWNVFSEGISVCTYGSGSPGIYSYSDSAYGVHTSSVSSNALYADTLREDNKYGIYTPDYLYAKGTQVPAADVAEYMPVTENVTPGTVMIIGEDGKLAESTTTYDTRVAGIVSTEPGVSLGTKDTGNPGEEQIAIGGRVPCKVDATKVPIHAGDLLTTSDLPGHAMKAEPIEVGGRTFYPSGIVLGKAMGTLESGTGVIEVLVTLQ